METPSSARPLLHVLRHSWSLRLLVPIVVTVYAAVAAIVLPAQRALAIPILIAVGVLARHDQRAARRYVETVRLTVSWVRVARVAGWNMLVRDRAAAREGVLRTHDISPALNSIWIDGDERVLLVTPLPGQTLGTYQSSAQALELALRARVRSVAECVDNEGSPTGRIEIRVGI